MWGGVWGGGPEAPGPIFSLNFSSQLCFARFWLPSASVSFRGHPWSSASENIAQFRQREMRGVAGARSSRRNSHRWVAYFQNPQLPTHIHSLSFVERGRIFPLKLENPTVAVLRFEILPPGAYIVRRVVANEPPRRYYRSKASFLDHQNPNQGEWRHF